jgi:hypothetical protein
VTWALCGSARSLLPPVVIFIVKADDIRITQRPQPVARDGSGEAVAAEHVEVLVLEWGQPGYALPRLRPP